MPKVAIITNGGLAGGHFNQGIPALVDLFHRLNARYRVIAYQAARTPTDARRARPFEIRPCSFRLRGAALAARLLVEHQRDPYSLVHGLWGTGGAIAVRIAGLLKIPAVVSLLGGETAFWPEIGYGGLVTRRSRRRLAQLCDRADALVVCSTFQARQLAQVTRRQPTVVPLGADPARFPFRSGALEPPYRLLHVANLTEVKDQVTLLEAFAKIRTHVPAELTVVGPDYLDGKLQSLAAALRLEDDVTFTGPVPHVEIAKHYSSAHILLHSSLHEAEAVVVAEAMASGVVVCGTAVGIVADLSPGRCTAVPVCDADALARAVLDLVQAPANYAALQAAGHRWAAAHSASWTGSRYSEIYGALLSRQETGQCASAP